jgi:hypothetical protein
MWPILSRIVAIPPIAGNTFYLDRVEDIPFLKGLGSSVARTEIPELRSHFFSPPFAEPFLPVYALE